METATETPKKVTGQHLLLALGVGLSLVVVLAAVGIINDNEPTSPINPTRSTLNTVWIDMTSSERLDFCAEARDAGYTVVVSEISSGTSYDRREVGYWLEDRCG